MTCGDNMYWLPQPVMRRGDGIQLTALGFYVDHFLHHGSMMSIPRAGLYLSLFVDVNTFEVVASCMP